MYIMYIPSQIIYHSNLTEIVTFVLFCCCLKTTANVTEYYVAINEIKKSTQYKTIIA